MLNPLTIEDAVKAALLEDLGRAGDITTLATIPASARARAVLAARQEGVIAGSEIAIAAFRMMGAKVTVVAPPTLVPRHLAEALGAEVSADIRDIEDADVVYVLRMQLERMGQGGFVPSLAEYARMYQVNHARLRDGQRVMHAGPVNRGVEISGAVVDDPSTLIEAQAGNGLVVRMAVLYDVLTEDKAGAPSAPGVTLEAA